MPISVQELRRDIWDLKGRLIITIAHLFNKKFDFTKPTSYHQYFDNPMDYVL